MFFYPVGGANYKTIKDLIVLRFSVIAFSILHGFCRHLRTAPHGYAHIKP